MGVTLRRAKISWKPSFRIIPSRFPPIDLFERIADPADWDALIELESLTNPRLRDEVGDISLVPAADRVSGPGASAIMAAFTHLNPEGSRFTDGTYGVFYCTPDLDTAIAETRYHRERFMSATKQEPQHLDMRVYLTDLETELHDIRGQQAHHPLVYHPTDYSGGQVLGRQLRTQGSNGIVYSSVRRDDGECAAVFRPKVLSNCRQERHLAYIWDGRKIRDVYEKRSL
jgi:RES domain